MSNRTSLELIQSGPAIRLLEGRSYAYWMDSASVTFVSVATPLRRAPRLMGKGVPAGTCGDSFTVATSNWGCCTMVADSTGEISHKRHKRLKKETAFLSLLCLLWLISSSKIEFDLAIAR